MSKQEQVKNHLLQGKPITPLDALTLYGSFRLSAIIFNLRNQGMNIKTEPCKRNGSVFAKYSLVK